MDNGSEGDGPHQVGVPFPIRIGHQVRHGDHGEDPDQALAVQRTGAEAAQIPGI